MFLLAVAFGFYVYDNHGKVLWNKVNQPVIKGNRNKFAIDMPKAQGPNCKHVYNVP